MSEKKRKKFNELINEISEFIGNHEMKNPHYLFDEEIFEAFPMYKKKHIKRALKEIR